MFRDRRSPVSSAALIACGRLFFAIALIAWGVQHFVAGDFVTRVVPSWPAGIPHRALWAYAAGAALIAAGVAIMADIQARAAAVAFAAMALLSFVFLHLPVAMRDVVFGGTWTSAGKALVMCGGAMCVAASLPERGREWLASPATRRAFVFWGRLCLGAFMILAGIQHFKFAAFVATLVPPWIPGGLFWTYFAAVALLAGGAGIILPGLTRLAALLSGAMIFSWVFLVHIPLALKDLHKPNDITATFEALAFSGVAFLIAGLVARTRNPSPSRWT